MRVRFPLPVQTYMRILNPIIKNILQEYKEISLLGKVSATLGWDLNVNLPEKASAYRAQQSAYLAELIVSKWLNPEFRKLIERANKEKGLSLEEKSILRNLNYATKFYYKVPKDLIIKKEKTTAGAFIDWRQAREENNFRKFQPHLSALVELDQKIADYLGYKKNPYDALLDLYEPGLTSDECQRLFNGIKNDLVGLTKKIIKSKKYKDKVDFINNHIKYDIADQEKISTYIISRTGY